MPDLVISVPDANKPINFKAFVSSWPLCGDTAGLYDHQIDYHHHSIKSPSLYLAHFRGRKLFYPSL